MLVKLIAIVSIFDLIKSDCVPIDDEELIQLKKLRDYEDCATRTSVTELQETGSYKCCHIYYEHDSNNLYVERDSCILINKTQYDNIEKYIDQMEEYDGLENVKIDCDGSNNKLYLLFSLAILLFLF